MRKNSSHENLLIESMRDLYDDFEELIYQIRSYYDYLQKFTIKFESLRQYFNPKSYQVVKLEAIKYADRLQGCLADLSKLQSLTVNGKYSVNNFNKLLFAKNAYFDLIRTQAGILGSLLVSLDWQSPSFAHSINSQAGVQTGKIKGTINDYKRDRHLDEEHFEKTYLREYLDSPFKFTLKSYLTNSGMAAFTTIFNYLLMEGKLEGKVLIGKASYFQYKQLLMKGLKDKVIEVDEMSTKSIIETIIKEKPCAIFLDSLCNAKEIPVPNLTEIINHLIKINQQEMYLVIDNTCLSTTFQPFKLIVGKTKKVRLIVFESLMKYLSFGADRVTGGIITASGKDAGKILEYRKHLGTNITDASVYALILPNRKLMEKRLIRFGRNAFLIASVLQDYIKDQKKSAFTKIVYPGLPNHSAYGWIENWPFHGCFFNLEFKKKSVGKYKKFIEITIKEAKKQKAELIGGTSFGLNTTRVYLTSLWTDYGEPFLRVAAGTETRLEIEKLKKVFVNAMTKFDRFPFVL